jgi:hypothetical protein
MWGTRVTRLFSDDKLLDAQPLRVAGAAGSGGSDVHPAPGDPLLLHAVLGPERTPSGSSNAPASRAVRSREAAITASARPAAISGRSLRSRPDSIVAA